MNRVIYATNIGKLLKYFILMFISAYYIGIFWYIMCRRVERAFEGDHYDDIVNFLNYEFNHIIIEQTHHK